MDIIVKPFSKFRDRRIAASDEYLDGNERDERRLYRAECERRLNAGESPPEAHRTIGDRRFIYGLGSRYRRASQLRPRNFNVLQYLSRARDADSITTVVLHSTRGPGFESTDIPPRISDDERSSHHRVDEIIAHFVIFRDGTIVYTHDVQYILSCAGKRKGIDIEFAGNFPYSRAIPAGTSRLEEPAILAGRMLIQTLKYHYLTNLRYIHPHGQVQQVSEGNPGHGGKYDMCSGPDVWVNVGEWLVNRSNFTSETTDPNGNYPNHGISSLQSNQAYNQHI